MNKEGLRSREQYVFFFSTFFLNKPATKNF